MKTLICFITLTLSLASNAITITGDCTDSRNGGTCYFKNETAQNLTCKVTVIAYTQKDLRASEVQTGTIRSGSTISVSVRAPYASIDPVEYVKGTAICN